MRLRKTSIAEQDLLGIWEYIARDSPGAADRFWLRLDARLNSLLKQPLAGESLDHLRPGPRSVVEGSYIIFYEPRPEELIVYPYNTWRTKMGRFAVKARNAANWDTAQPTSAAKCCGMGICAIHRRG